MRHFLNTYLLIKQISTTNCSQNTVKDFLIVRRVDLVMLIDLFQSCETFFGRSVFPLMHPHKTAWKNM